MNDITKARYYLKTKGSKLQHLESFGLMLSSAEQRYREIRQQMDGNKAEEGTLELLEVDCALDLAVLRYLRKHNHLPRDLPKVFHPKTALEEKRALASHWLGV